MVENETVTTNPVPARVTADLLAAMLDNNLTGVHDRLDNTPGEHHGCRIAVAEHHDASLGVDACRHAQC